MGEFPSKKLNFSIAKKFFTKIVTRPEPSVTQCIPSFGLKAVQ